MHASHVPALFSLILKFSFFNLDTCYTTYNLLTFYKYDFVVVLGLGYTLLYTHALLVRPYGMLGI